MKELLFVRSAGLRRSMVGYAFVAARTIPPDIALALPGTYAQEGLIFMLGTMYRV